MAVTHHCEGVWIEGTARSCPKHQVNRNRQPLREGLKARRKADQAAGIVGIDRMDTHGYIDGGKTNDFG